MEALIKETYTLPSLGKVYDEQFDPEITIRSMTMEEEMKRLGHNERPNKIMSEIIDRCLVDKKPKISSYDMCLGDYNFLYHKLRVVTYGKMCNMETVCPVCGAVTKTQVDLDGLKISTYTEELEKYRTFKLPQSGHEITIGIQTPRDIDTIVLKKKEFLKRHQDFEGEPALLLNLLNVIRTIDSEKVPETKLETFVRKLPMKDVNFILRCAEKLSSGIGVNTSVEVNCQECGLAYTSSFRPNSEFFGPEIDL